MTEQIERTPRLLPEDIKGRRWFTNRYGVDEGKLGMTGVIPSPTDQSQVLDGSSAEPKSTGNDSTEPREELVGENII